MFNLNVSCVILFIIPMICSLETSTYKGKFLYDLENNQLIHVFSEEPLACTTYKNPNRIQEILANITSDQLITSKSVLMKHFEEICSISFRQGESVDTTPLDLFLDIEGILKGIFPGTRWCGQGNISSSYEDLGRNEKEDICCREHDHCERIIPPGRSLGNLENPSTFTRSSCSCDDRFSECLGRIDSQVSEALRILFFYFGPEFENNCFEEDCSLQTCLLKYRTGLRKSFSELFKGMKRFLAIMF